MSSLTLESRQKNRRLPQVDIPILDNDEMRRFSESIKEHLRMYEGDSGAPKERFVTLEELELVGLVQTKTQSGFASIDKVLGEQVARIPSVAGISSSRVGSGGIRKLRNLEDTDLKGISGGQGIVWNGSKFIPRSLPEFILDDSTLFDMMFYDGANWTHTAQELQWNPTDDYLQLANEHSINWLDDAGVTVELAILGAGVTGDSDIASVVLLTAVENTDGEGDQAFVVAVGGHTLTATEASTGVAEVQGAEAKFGDFSMFADDAAGGVKARWGTTINSTDFDFGSGDFTMECHLLFNRLSSTDIPIFAKWIFNHFSFHWDFNSTTERFSFNRSLNGTSNVGGVAIAWPPSITITTGTWYHMAASREGNTIRFFVDGVLCATQQNVTGETFFTGNTEFEIFSQDSNGAGDHATYMDNARITKGVARYKVAFTPPTAAFPTTGNVTAAFTLGDPLFDTYLDANEIRIRGATTDNYLAFDHDDTDINIVGVNTTDINFSALTAIRLDDVKLTIAGATAANEVSFSHDDTDLNIAAANTTDINFLGGLTLKLFDSGDSDSLAMSHDGTKFDFVFFQTNEVKFTGTTSSYVFDRIVAITPTVIGQGFHVFDSINATLAYDVFQLKMTGAGVATYRLHGMTDIQVDPNLVGLADITAVTIAGIAAADLVDKAADETISGEWTHSDTLFLTSSGIFAPAVRVISTVPAQSIVETDAASDEKAWDTVAVAGQLRFRTTKDDYTGGVTWMAVNRTAEAVDSVAFSVPITATSYGGILQANLLDKTATEVWTGASLTFNDSKRLKFGDSGDVSLKWDATNLKLEGTSGTFIITGFPIAAGTINADFDAITGTSYGGILEANLVDKAAAEAITGAWTYSGNLISTGYFHVRGVTTAALAAVANAINTDAGKVQGAMLYNTDTDNPVYAVGNADADVWVDGAGTTVHTPV